MLCKNNRCKFNNNHQCDGKCSIDEYGKCTGFEKGFIYYLCYALDFLKSTNYIDFIDINNHPDIRYSIYYLMRVYHLIFSEKEFGTCRFLQLHVKEGEQGLNSAQILDLPMDDEEFGKCFLEFIEKGLPSPPTSVEKKVSSQPFGWLSPRGKFIEGDMGDHEKVAREIISNNPSFKEEFQLYRKEHIVPLARDFLAEVKGYCLIHNPTGSGGYLVSHVKRLTKSQKEFLYEYFISMGDRFKAEHYLN